MRLLSNPGISAIYVAARMARDDRPSPPWRYASWPARLAGIAMLALIGSVAAILAIPVMALADYLLHG